MLRVFQAILSDKAFRKQEGAGEVIHLATHVTRNLFTRLAPDNPYEGEPTDPLYTMHAAHASSYDCTLRLWKLLRLDLLDNSVIFCLLWFQCLGDHSGTAESGSVSVHLQHADKPHIDIEQAWFIQPTQLGDGVVT